MGRFEIPAEKVPAVGARSLLNIAGRSLALFNVDGQLYVINDACPHQGASLLGGHLEGRSIRCCAHGLRFDLASGYLLNSTLLKVESYPVHEVDGRVFIVIEESLI
ncbi:Naphthalene 1,2-dioxygenase/salicylate 5-hydroxylase system, ferredoxin component [compost metagenome]